MRIRIAIRLGSAVLAMALSPQIVFGYIHFPPMTLPKMCKTSTHIRILTVKKQNQEKGVIIFEVAESLKGQKSNISSFKHVIRTVVDGVKPILDWVGAGNKAVMFSIETDPRGAPIGIGYVFIDNFCYTVDYNRAGECWLLVRPEPQMSACYYGSVEQLQKTVHDILAGKQVQVPVREPETKPDPEKRRQEINDFLKTHRK